MVTPCALLLCCWLWMGTALAARYWAMEEWGFIEDCKRNVRQEPVEVHGFSRAAMSASKSGILVRAAEFRVLRG